MIFNVGLLLIIALVIFMIINLYEGYKVLQQYEETEEGFLTSIVSKKIKRALTYAFLSLCLTGIWALVWIKKR